MKRKRKLKSSFHKSPSLKSIMKEILTDTKNLKLPNQVRKKPIRKKCRRCNKRERMKHKGYCKKCQKEK